MTRIREDLAERVLAAHPLPIADALGAMLAADSVFEMRDRVVEVFRVELRLIAALVLAARLQLGPGPAGESPQVPDLLRALRARGLTDGQWVALLREALRSWTGVKEGYPLPELVQLIHARKSELVKLFDELLVMRKSETVAHGATGTRAAIEEILDRRVPQLARTLELLDPMWNRARLCFPLSPGEDAEEGQSAWLLMGSTPHRGRFRKVQLSSELKLQPGEAALIDPEGKPLVALHPIALFRRPSPDAVEELFVLDGGTKRGAVYVAFPSMAEHREADAWVAIEGALSDTEPASEKAGAAAAERPYRGLSSFGPEDSALFFGREEQAESLANRIRRNGFLTVTGPSGSGKTSLLRAGVLPLLRDAFTTFVRPGADPIASLAAKLGESLGRDRSDIAALERSDPELLAREVERHARESERIHVVVIDQGEEMLTLCADAAAREMFARTLARMATSEGHVRVVFGVREDFFGRLATVPSLRDTYSRVVEVVTTPDRNGLIRTLVAPAQVFGYSFEDEDLVTTMVDEVQEAPAALALLQFCADRLWEQRDRKWKRLTWDAYKAMGGVAGALASHADRVIASMSAAERSTCRSLFLRLISGERTRTVVTRKELLDGLRDPDAGARALDALIAARLVAVSDDATGQPQVEIVHEALIKHWEQLDRWLSEDEEGQRLAHAMRQAAREWNARKRPRDLVWRGDLLEELRHYKRRVSEGLAGVEAAFAEASEREARRGRNVRVGLIGAALALSTGFAIFAAWQWRSTEAARVEAEGAKNATAREKVNVEVRGLVAEARGHEPTGRTGQALALLRAASALESEHGETRSTLLSLELERLERAGVGGLVLAGHTSALYRVCIPANTDRIVTSAFDQTTRIWERSTGRLLVTIPPHENVVRALACSPDGETVIVGNSDARDQKAFVRQYRIEDGTLVRAFEGPTQSVDYIQWLDGGGEFISFGQDGFLWYFDADTGEVTTKLVNTEGSFYDYQATPDGRMIATVDDRGVALWMRGASKPFRSFPVSERVAAVALADDGAHVSWSTLEGGVVPIVETATGHTVREMKPAGTLGVAHLAYSPGGRWLITSGPRGVDIWDAVTGASHQRLRVDPQHDQFYLSPDGDRIVTLRSGVVAELWDIPSGARLAGFTGHHGDIQIVAFSPDGEIVVTGSYDKTAIVHDAISASHIHVWRSQKEFIQTLAISADGRYAATAAGTAAVRIHRTSGEGLSPPVAASVTDPSKAFRIAFSPSADVAAIAYDRGVVKLVDLVSTASTDIELGSPGRTVAWSADGASLAAGTLDGTVTLMAANGTVTKKVRPHEKAAIILEFDPRGELLVVGYLDGKVRAIRLSDGEVVFALDDIQGPPTDIDFSPDGSSLAIADNQHVRWVDRATWDKTDLPGHEQAIMGVAFSPDGKILATASADQRTLLHTKDGQPARVLTGHTAGVLDVAFSPDGERLVTSSQDGTARVWDVRLAAPLDVLEPFGEDVRMARFAATDRIVSVGSKSVAVMESAPADRKASLLATGGVTNLRVCRSTFAVVPIAPPPAAESVWADDAACSTNK